MKLFQVYGKKGNEIYQRKEKHERNKREKRRIREYIVEMLKYMEENNIKQWYTRKKKKWKEIWMNKNLLIADEQQQNQESIRNWWILKHGITQCFLRKWTKEAK